MLPPSISPSLGRGGPSGRTGGFGEHGVSERMGRRCGAGTAASVGGRVWAPRARDAPMDQPRAPRPRHKNTGGQPMGDW